MTPAATKTPETPETLMIPTTDLREGSPHAQPHR